MTNREKLIELLKEADLKAWEVEENRQIAHLGEVWGWQADYLIANGVTVTDNNVGGKWIPVTERLPEIDQPCLCYKRAHREDGYKLGRYLGASFSKECAAFRSMSHYGCIGVTHWMPLPEPPKGE